MAGVNENGTTGQCLLLLQGRYEDLWKSRLARAEVLDVGHYSHDLARMVLFDWISIEAYANLLAEGIFVREGLACESFVYDGDRRRARSVSFIQQTAATQRNVKQLEEAGSDLAICRVRSFAFRHRRTPDDREGKIARDSVRNGRAGCNGFHSGDRDQLLQEIPVEGVYGRRPLFHAAAGKPFDVFVTLGEIDVGDQNIPRIDAGIDGTEARHGADHER